MAHPLHPGPEASFCAILCAIPGPPIPRMAHPTAQSPRESAVNFNIIPHRKFRAKPFSPHTGRADARRHHPNVPHRRSPHEALAKCGVLPREAARMPQRHDANSAMLVPASPRQKPGASRATCTNPQSWWASTDHPACRDAYLVQRAKHVTRQTPPTAPPPGLPARVAGRTGPCKGLRGAPTATMGRF